MYHIKNKLQEILQQLLVMAMNSQLGGSYNAVALIIGFLQ
jgi:hypothetical protein